MRTRNPSSHCQTCLCLSSSCWKPLTALQQYLTHLLPSHSGFSWVSAPCSFSWSQFQPAAAFQVQDPPSFSIGKISPVLHSPVFGSDITQTTLLLLWSCPYLLLCGAGCAQSALSTAQLEGVPRQGCTPPFSTGSPLSAVPSFSVSFA